MESLKPTIQEHFEVAKHLTQKRFAGKSYYICPKCGREWRTRIVNGEKTYDLHSRCECGYAKYESVELINNIELSIPVLTQLATAYRNEIHEYLAPSNIPDKEETIRSYIRDIMTVVLPLVKKKREALEDEAKQKIPNRTIEYDKLGKALEAFYQLEDDYTALVAFRHFETFVLYIDKHVYASDIFTPALHLFKGFYYFANSMALRKDVRFIEKQCFAGAGKSATDSIFMSWLFGIDINNDVLKYFGSKANIIQTIDMVTHIMLSPQYAKVFPYYAKFDSNPNNMFDMLKTTDGVMKISGSIKAVNLRVCAKGDDKDGIRAKYLFLDDITLATDAEKVEKHEFDKYLYTSRWFKRKYDLNNFFIIASGTTYHQQDILSYLKGIFGIDDAKPSKKFKFTSVGKSNEIVPNGISVFCVIYGLDENEKSTFEKRFPTEQFLLERDKNPRNFAAMVQQEPQPPEGSPFDYDNLPNQYGKEGIPHLPDRSQETCTASLDPARKGYDFNSMPIINSIGGELFFQDCIYERCPPDKLPLKVVDMIEKHHIVRLDIENNTDTTFDVLIKKLLAERGIDYCLVTSFFSYKKKGDKIMDCETAIKKIHFPKRECYTPKSQMGQFMHDLLGYNYEIKVKHDDAPDSLANYAQTYIINKRRGATITPLKSRRYA